MASPFSGSQCRRYHLFLLAIFWRLSSAPLPGPGHLHFGWASSQSSLFLSPGATPASRQVSGRHRAGLNPWVERHGVVTNQWNMLLLYFYCLTILDISAFIFRTFYVSHKNVIVGLPSASAVVTISNMERDCLFSSIHWIDSHNLLNLDPGLRKTSFIGVQPNYLYSNIIRQ